MNGTPKPQPKPTGPLPFVLAYASASEGCTPARPGATAMGTENVAVPEDNTGANDSPMPSTDPSALGSEIACGVTAVRADVPGNASGVMESNPSGGAESMRSAASSSS